MAATAFAASEPLSTAHIREFLAAADAVAWEPIGLGVTDAWRVTLSDGTVTHDAAFQSIDVAARRVGGEGRPVADTPQLQWWARAGITPASITLGSPFSPLPGVTGQQSTARYSVCTAHNWGSRRQLSTQRPRALHSPNPSREMPGASLFPIPLGEELSDPLPRGTWNFTDKKLASSYADRSGHTGSW